MNTVFPSICQYCNKTYSNQANLLYHQKNTKYCLKIQEELKNSDLKCQYCDKIFSTQSNLAHHQKTTKSCYNNSKIDLTGQPRDIIIFECDGCNKTYTSKLNFDKHISTCLILKDKQYKLLEKKISEERIEYQSNILKEKEQFLEQVKLLKSENISEKQTHQNEIRSLNKQLENSRIELATISGKLKEVEKQLLKQENINKHLQDRLIDKATTKTNTTTNNIDLKLFISEEIVNEKIQNKFNKTHLINGYSGLANFIKSEIATNEEGKLIYTCSDPSRQIFNYTDEKGNEVKDIKGTKMLSLVKPKLMEKTCQIQAKEQDEYNYLCKRYNGDIEVADESVKQRIDLHKLYSDAATDMIVNKIGDNKFPAKMSSELAKVLT